jgi:Na+/melibiose symporter-like transporter
MKKKQAIKRLRMIETEIRYLEKQIKRKKKILDTIHSGRYFLKVMGTVILIMIIGTLVSYYAARRVGADDFFLTYGIPMLIFLMVFFLVLVLVFRDSAEKEESELRHGMECWMKYYGKEKERILSEHPELKYEDIRPWRIHYWEILQIYELISTLIFVFLAIWYPMMTPNPLPILTSILVLLVTFANYLYQRHFSHCPYEN